MSLLFRHIAIAPRLIRPGLGFNRSFSITPVIPKQQLDQPDLKTPPKQSQAQQPKLVTNTSKYDKIISKLPKSLQKYGRKLLDSPVSHFVSFLTLHELSAVIPFVGLWYFFHNCGFLPTDVPSWVILKGSGFIERLLGDSMSGWSIQERTKLIIEGATAYGIVKAMFIPRVLVSLFLTPWFARVIVEPIFGLMGKLFGKQRVNQASLTRPPNELGELSPKVHKRREKKSLD